MPDQDPTPELHGLDAGELLARALQTARPSGRATDWIPPEPAEVANLLPQYRIESLLGRGGMGAVYKGWQINLERPVAIKLLPAEMAADQSFVARFTREARTLAQLQHPGIVAIFEFGQTTEGHLYFVMEFVDGVDLQKMLRGPRLEPGQALTAIVQICEALHYAHTRGVVHRDIKPANVIFTREGQAKLADFGLAMPLNHDGDSLTHSHATVGTPDYMAPEQREGHADQRADIYALGVMLYEMLTGRRPQGVFTPPSQRVPVDARIDSVVLKALQQEPELRYQDVQAMQTEVNRIRFTPPPETNPPAAKAASSHRTLVLSGVGAVAIFLSLAGYGWWTAKHAPRTESMKEEGFAHASPERTVAMVPAAPPPATPSPSTPSPATPTPIAMATPAPQVIPTTPAPVTLAKPEPVATPPPMIAASTPPPAPAPAATPPPAATPSVPSLLSSFSRQIPNLSSWVLAPLDESVPTDIRQNLLFLREDLADEARRAPANSANAYRLGAQICQTLLAIHEERALAQAKAGFRNVEANARTGASSQALEARRNYMMSWPQYSREQSQRAELQSQAANNAAVMKERPKLDWAQRASQLHPMLDTLYAQLRMALRQMPASR